MDVSRKSCNNLPYAGNAESHRFLHQSWQLFCLWDTNYNYTGFIWQSLLLHGDSGRMICSPIFTRKLLGMFLKQQRFQELINNWLYLLLGNSTQPCVHKQHLLTGHLIDQSIKLRTIADSLLHLQWREHILNGVRCLPKASASSGKPGPQSLSDRCCLLTWPLMPAPPKRNMATWPEIARTGDIVISLQLFVSLFVSLFASLFVSLSVRSFFVYSVQRTIQKMLLLAASDVSSCFAWWMTELTKNVSGLNRS